MKTDKVQHYFKTVPTATEAFTTSDGTVFTAKHYAESFAQELKDKTVKTHKREDFEVDDEAQKKAAAEKAAADKAAAKEKADAEKKAAADKAAKSTKGKKPEEKVDNETPKA